MRVFQTAEEFKHLEASSGFYEVPGVAKQVFGVTMLSLKRTNAFAEYPVGALMPACDFIDIVTECYSAQHPVFLGTIAASAGYATPQSFKRAVNSSGIVWPIQKDAEVWWMEQSSYMAGPMNVKQITAQRSRDQLLREIRILVPGSSSV